MSVTGDTISPNEPGMPEPPSGDFFNETQWAVLLALADAVIPSITPESRVTDEKIQRCLPDQEYHAFVQFNKDKIDGAPGDESLLEALLDDRPSKHPAFLHHCRRTLSSLPGPARKQLGGVLSALA